MSLSEFTEQPAPEPIAPTLADRRPGHAVMTRLLAELEARGASNVVPPDLASWHTGAIGEQLVGAELARLPDGWRVLHAVPAGPVADIDHLVIGPAGTFVINTKRHPGKRIRVGTRVVWIDGFQQNHYQQNLLDRTAKVRIALSDGGTAVPPVHSLLVFVDASTLGTSGEQSVMSCTASQLISRLVALEPVMPPTLVEDLYRRACLPATWGRNEAVLLEPDPSARFVGLLASRPQTSALRSAPRSGTRTTMIRRKRRRYITPPPSTNRLLLRLTAAIGAIALAPIAMTLGVGIFAAVVRILLPH